MKSLDTKVIGHLNTVLKNELTAINQYFLHAKMLDDWGLKKMGKMEMEESVDEMKHADSIIERILFLEGLPNLQDLGKLMIGQNVKEMLECDLALEMIAIPDLRAAIVDCEACGDFGSRDLFNHILMSEEELQKVWILRKIVHEMDDLAAIEFLLGKMKKSKTNEEFFASMKRS